MITAAQRALDFIFNAPRSSKVGVVVRREPLKSKQEHYEDFFIFLTNSMIASAIDEMQHHEKIMSKISRAKSSRDQAEMGKIVDEFLDYYYHDEATIYAENKVSEEKYL